jgi:hypothetical protein
MAQRVSNVSNVTTEHEEIRRWVEERGGWPAAVEGTSRGEGDPGMIRIDFPGYTGEGKLRRIGWDEWLEKFDASGLAFVYEETLASGQRSNFNKLVARETAEARLGGERTSRRAQRGASRGSARSRTRTGSRSGGRSGARASSARGGASGGARRGSRGTGAKRGGTRRQAPRAEAARTTSRRGTGRGRAGSSRRTQSRSSGRSKRTGGARSRRGR